MLQQQDKLPSARIKIFPSLDALSHAAADLFLKLAADSVKHKGKFSAALSGGSTPKSLFELLASPDYKAKIPWSGVHLFWGDERCVPKDHADSNYRLAQETLISNIDIPAGNVHPMPGDMEATQGARAYEDGLRSFFAGEEVPRFDLVILGLGTDGHTASLFPFSESLGAGDRIVVADKPKHVMHTRLTLTLRVINNAAAILFLVSGKDKPETLAQVLGDKAETGSLPAQMVFPESGVLYWFVDEAAALRLK